PTGTSRAETDRHDASLDPDLLDQYLQGLGALGVLEQVALARSGPEEVLGQLLRLRAAFRVQLAEMRHRHLPNLAANALAADEAPVGVGLAVLRAPSVPEVHALTSRARYPGLRPEAQPRRSALHGVSSGRSARIAEWRPFPTAADPEIALDSWELFKLG